MFSGIVETIGHIIQLEDKHGCKYLSIHPQMHFHDLTIGDSVSVNGVCLTVTHFTPDSFHVTAVPETLRLTNLNSLCVGDAVNLERSLTLDKRIGGHFVQGHIDTMGQILEIQQDHDALLVKISIPEQLANYIVRKGYITLDGMSITVIDDAPTYFTVTFIPHTQQATIVNLYKKGRWINIEVDMMAKYIEKLCQR